MRVIAGSLGGRRIKSPSGHKTHPMSDKIRGAIFNMLGDVSGLSLLDAFAGSGAVGIEAISRGAQHVTAVDSDKNAHQAIVENINELKISNSVKAIKANVSSWSDNNPDKLYDILICDPPYNKIQPKLLNSLGRHVKSGSLAVYSLPPNSNFQPDLEFTEIAAKDYGDAAIVIYRRN